jgi:sugar O-acyltransferase (sialic acid O-acetyltransferase NeuD family)
MNELTLYGAGGHGHSVLELVRSLNKYRVNAFWDDQPRGESIHGVAVTKPRFNIKNLALCISVGNNEHRKRIAERFKGADFPSFVHPSCTLYPSVKIGQGTVILPQTILDASVTIGDFCIINNHATVSHNVIIDDYAHIAIQAAISGGVTIGEGTLIGAGSVILPEVKIGKWAIVGAGSIVTKDVPDFAVVYGNPAVVKRIQKEL